MIAIKKTILFALSLAITVTLISLNAPQVEAGQGCPFDDGSCQEYCNQQGCNLGYCGHFAWIQCICRKCGDEWSWYDKVRYNPNKTINQTELESLKLNGTSPLILTNGSSADNTNIKEQNGTKQKEENNKPATLITLLIPDLSDNSGKLDLNDIPDENSDKFLDYLAKNHEKLVQATSSTRLTDSQQRNANNKDDSGDENQGEDEETTTEAPTSTVSSTDDELLEITQ